MGGALRLQARKAGTTVVVDSVVEGGGLMPEGSVWLCMLEWPEPEERAVRLLSGGGSVRRVCRRPARRPLAWMSL